MPKIPRKWAIATIGATLFVLYLGIENIKMTAKCNDAQNERKLVEVAWGFLRADEAGGKNVEQEKEELIEREVRVNRLLFRCRL